jgi:hypothetical protein
MKHLLAITALALAMALSASAQSTPGTLALAQQGVGCGPTFPAITCNVPVVLRVSGQAVGIIHVLFQIVNSVPVAHIQGVDGKMVKVEVKSYTWIGHDVHMEIAGIAALTGSEEDDTFEMIFDTHYSLSRACGRCNLTATVASFNGTFEIIN